MMLRGEAALHLARGAVAPAVRGPDEKQCSAPAQENFGFKDGTPLADIFKCAIGKFYNLHFGRFINKKKAKP